MYLSTGFAGLLSPRILVVIFSRAASSLSSMMLNSGVSVM